MEPAEIQNEQFRELLENFINFLRKKCYKERPINKYRRILAVSFQCMIPLQTYSTGTVAQLV